jgi:hypothetical protein
MDTEKETIEKRAVQFFMSLSILLATVNIIQFQTTDE